MSLLYDDRPVPIHVRTRIGVPIPRIEFGAPGPLDGAGGYRYEISPEDRHVLDQTIRDAGSSDPTIASLALDAMKTAAQFFPPAKLAIQVGEFIWNLLGFGVKGAGSLSSGALVVHGSHDPYYYGTNKGTIVLTSATYDPSTGEGVIKGRAWANPYGCMDPSKLDPNRIEYGWTTGHLGFSVGDVPYSLSGNYGGGGISSSLTNSDRRWNCDNVTDYFKDSPHSEFGFYDNTKKQNVTLVSTNLGSKNYKVCGYSVYDDGDTNRLEDWTCRELPGGDGSFGDVFDLDELSPLPNELDPRDSNLTPGEITEEFIPRLRDSEYWEQYGTPYDEPPTQQLPGEPHPKDPNWPCNPGSGGVEVPRVRVGGPGFRTQRPPGFDPPGKPGDEMCVIVGGKRRCGKIRRMPPPGEDIIVEQPPYRDERFTKHWCPKKGRLIVGLVKQLAGELGFNPGESGWIVDTDCKKRWPGGCFKKGTSKFDAMWRLADMCGDIFDREPPHIGKIKPLPPDLRTYGPYHEYRDLFVFEAVQDDLDIPSHVEVYVPHFRNQRGYSVVVEVDTPYDLKDKWLRIRAPKNMSEADAMDWAAKKARYYEITTQLTDFAIPYEHGQYVQRRTQMKLRIPSEGYDGRFMVWEFSHEIDVDEGAATKIRGVRLSENRYAPRFEDYRQVWQNAPAGYGVMS